MRNPILKLAFTLVFLHLIHPISIFGIFSSNRSEFHSCECRNPKHGLKFYKPKEFSKKFNAFFYPCRIKPNAVSDVEKKLKETVFGQKDALKIINSHISSHLNCKMDVLKKSPLVLHFAGDFGVGKTLTASLISAYLFEGHLGKDVTDHYCTEIVSGSNYLPPGIAKSASVIKDQKEKIKRIRGLISSQIRKCSKSLIIINDLQKMDSDIFSKLEDFFEGTAFTSYGKLITKESIFILTSDLGSADVSRSWGYSKLEKEIKRRFSLYTDFNKKLNSLVVHVPFKTLDKTDLRKIISGELLESLSCSEAFDCVSFTKKVVDYLLEKWSHSEIIQKMNGRAFQKYIFPTYVEREINRADYLEQKKLFKRWLILKIEKHNESFTLKTQITYRSAETVNPKIRREL